MSARDKDARAAMKVLLRSWLAGEIDGPMEPSAVAHDAWNYADAMAAERAKRVPAAAPATITDKDGTRLTFTPTGDGKVRVHATEPAHVASLQAVAEAAADACRLPKTGLRGTTWTALESALDRAVPGWRSKVTP